MARSQHIGVLAGEKSGDILGGAVLRELKRRNSDLSFSGIGGEQMALHGLTSLHDMERLSVFGLVEPLARLPELLSIRRSVGRHMIEHQPQLFLGIDSPDFNLAKTPPQGYQDGPPCQSLSLGVAPGKNS
jgi:lipid-A-disaccharide synthase